MISSKYYPILAVLILPTVAGAACKDFIATDSFVDSSTDASISFAYSNYCANSRRKRGLNIGFDVSTIVDALPVGITGNVSSTRSKISNLCRSSDAKNLAESRRFIAGERVIRESIAAAVRCEEIRRTGGVVINPTITRERATFEISRTENARNLTQIAYNKAQIDCTASIQGKVQTVGSRYERGGHSRWEIGCRL